MIRSTITLIILSLSLIACGGQSLTSPADGVVAGEASLAANPCDEARSLDSNVGCEFVTFDALEFKPVSTATSACGTPMEVACTEMSFEENDVITVDRPTLATTKPGSRS